MVVVFAFAIACRGCFLALRAESLYVALSFVSHPNRGLLLSNQTIIVVGKLPQAPPAFFVILCCHFGVRPCPSN